MAVIIGFAVTYTTKYKPAREQLPNPEIPSVPETPVATSTATSTSPATSTTSGPVGEETLIVATSPARDSLVKSPLKIEGRARGNWYFEASFPARLFDANGTQLAVVAVQAKGDWMTTEFVDFSGTLVFANPTTETGTLVLEKDNPSGLPEFDKSISIPVRFK